MKNDIKIEGKPALTFIAEQDIKIDGVNPYDWAFANDIKVNSKPFVQWIDEEHGLAGYYIERAIKEGIPINKEDAFRWCVNNGKK